MEREPSAPFQSPEDAVKEKMEVLKNAQPEKYTDPVTGEVDEATLRADAVVVVRQSMRPRE